MRQLLIIPTVVATMLWASACSPAEQADGPPAPAPTVTPEVTATPDGEPTAPPTPEDGDDVAVALDAEGRVVVLDATTGDEVRELLDGLSVDDPADNHIAMAPDSDDVFVVVPPDEPSGEPDIVRVPVQGGEAETVVEGTVPAVSPDGQTLAYVTYEAAAAERGTPEPVLVLRDLDSGAQTRLSREDPFYAIPEVAWTADGTHVVFTAGEIYTGLYAVDRDADDLDAARRLGPDLDDESGMTSWGPVAALDDDRLAVVETCCDVPRDERWRVVEVDVTDGTVQASLLPDERVEATHLDSDTGSGALLIVVGGGPGGGQLFRWDGGGEPEQLAGDIIVAAW